MLGSFSSKDLSTTSKDTSLMFTFNLPSVGKETQSRRGRGETFVRPKWVKTSKLINKPNSFPRGGGKHMGGKKRKELMIKERDVKIE